LLLVGFVFVDDLGVDDVFISVRCLLAFASSSSLSLGVGVDCLAQLGLRSLQLLERVLDLVVVVLLLKSSLQCVNVGLNLGLDLFWQLVFVVLDQLVHRVGCLFGSIAGLSSFAACLVLFGVCFSFL